jgi:hypothetical protein
MSKSAEETGTVRRRPLGGRGFEGEAYRLTAAARVLDPNGVLNRHVLLDPVDRLEV